MADVVTLPQNKGSYQIVRVSGAVEVVQEKPHLRAILKAIDAEAIDTVTLTHFGGRPQTVMMCDDTGMIDHKPVNPMATRLYHDICKPGTTWSIHGDVAIVNDGDFGSL